MDINLKDVLATLKTATDAAQALAPTLIALGVPGIGMATAAIEAAEAVKAGIEQHKVIAETDDMAELEALIARLKATANDLGAEIEAS